MSRTPKPSSRRWATVLPAHPRTGRTHQLRVHMAGLGLPIDNDPLYPDVIDVAADDFTAPLRLVAHRLEFDDPLTGESRSFVSSRGLADDPH